MYYDQEISSVFEEFGVSEAGLSSEEAEKRLKEYGENELKEKEKVSVLQLFISQFKSILIFILITASIVSALLGEFIDAIVIIFTVFLAGILSFVQEYRAEKAIELLRSLTSPEATVIRDGVENKTPSKKISFLGILSLFRPETAFQPMPGLSKGSISRLTSPLLQENPCQFRKISKPCLPKLLKLTGQTWSTQELRLLTEEAARLLLQPE